MLTRSVQWAAFILLVVVISLPTFIYVASASLPRDNILHIDPHAWYIEALSHGALPLIMLFINTIVLPPAACRLSEADGNASPKILIGRLLNTLMIPAMVTLYLDQGCFQGFMHLWQRCQPEMAAQSQLPVGCPFGTTTTTTTSSGSVTLTIPYNCNIEQCK